MKPDPARALLLGALAATAVSAGPARLFRLHDALPPCTVRVMPTWQSEDARDDVRLRGTIEIACPGLSEQSIEFETSASADLIEQEWFLRLEDVDLDGNTDIGVLHRFGAKWGGYVHHLFDPATGTFVTSHLSRQLDDALSGNGLEIDREAGLLIVPYLQFSGTVEHDYRIACDTVELAGIVDRVCLHAIDGPCISIRWQLLPDGWLVTKALPLAPDQ